ncbi:metallophosphoesterase [Roseateles sp. BYS78W]|uniref:Metallophosphoesterase n=1 Tax=Pelomonas candidula TaxID=3299025 RepID=A0ABW7HEZ0_9BURK
MTGPVLYCGDPHGAFGHIIEAADRTQASAVILLGDLEPQRPLHIELAPLIEREVPIYWIPGNHDGDSVTVIGRVWGSKLSDRNIHGRVVTLPDYTRLAGLGCVFRSAVWMPDPAAPGGDAPKFRSRAEHAKATPRQDRFEGGPHFRHMGTIYHDEFERLADMQADILATHEAPGEGHHPYGFDILVTLAQVMGARIIIHGHQHDARRTDVKGVKCIGVGLRGVTAVDANGNTKVIVPGELDEARGYGQRDPDIFGEG